MKVFGQGQWCRTTQRNSKARHPKFSKQAVLSEQPGDVAASAHEEAEGVRDWGAAGFTELELFY